ncbi:conserved Plasmodium membrane protein, unknown function [Plasmodium gallinaceum]|uniref:Uncharacterized protein n=1 Tax=Plasmodium gallinaceum TaxID=5849 RepID=A0A1J1GY68_PLAGA|nr:conserved Plasmodium membrane protein, unknown function [Plasmodium gallinaceum]CRG97208.1 conserved Plasmodium membrane protein, unknown function [Plasmodium gallinaceum]
MAYSENKKNVINDEFFCKLIKTELQNLTENYKKKIKKVFWFEYLYKTEGFIISIFLIPLFIGKLLLKENDIISTNYLIFLFVLILLLLLLFTIIYYETEKAQNNQYINKINEGIKFLSSNNFTKNKKGDFPFNYFPNSNFIFILRNKKWELLPTNLLIKEDIFLLRAGDLIPCHCAEYNINENVYGKKYEKNEIFMPINKNKISFNLLTKYPKDEKREYLPSFHLYSFVSYDNVSISIIKKYIEDNVVYSKSLKNKKNLRNIILTEKIHILYIYMWIILFSISSVLSIIYFLDIKKSIDIPHFVIIYFLIYNILMSITLLPFFHRIFSELIYGYCSSLNMVYANYFKDKSYEKKTFSSSYDFSSTTDDSSYVNKKKIGLFYNLKNNLLLIIKGIKVDKRHLNILSDCSVLCFLDSSGIIVNTNHSIKEICIYNYLNNKKDFNLNNNLKSVQNNYNYILTIIDIFMDNKSMYAYQRIQNIKILHSLFLISYYTQIPKYLKLLDEFQNNILNYMNQSDYSYLYICLCDIGNISFSYNKFIFHKLFFCIENKSNYELYKRKCTQLKKYKKSIISDDEIPYYVNENNERENLIGINIYDNLTTRDNFVFIFILYEKKKDKYHMFLKGQLEALVSKCMFYYDGKTIKKLKRRKKKELRILNMQWISSGIESICFAYRPLSCDEVKYLKQNFLKNIYIVTISKKKVYNIKNFYNEESFPLKENENFLSHLLSTTIFIGNSAVKLLTNNEIQSRINDFYEAGIRFVYFSKSDEINTRNIANLLGMETNWNTSISLSFNEKPSFINRDGKVVIPSGINNIKRHIEEVDDIPLRVSLYSGCNKFNTAEMIKILLKNNEIITCVGNSLNCCNFDIYNLCDYSISILLPFNNICKDCYGKKEKSNPFEDFSSKKNPLLLYSSFINSFPCNLIIEKNNLDLSQNTMELVYKLLKSSRIYKKNVSLMIFYFYFYYSYLSFLVFIILVFCLPPFISVVDYLLFIFLIIPLLSVCLLNNNNNSSIMNDIPDKVITKEFLIKKLIFFLIKWIPMLIYSSILSLYYLHLININFIKKYRIENELIKQKLSNDFGKNFIDDLIYQCSQNVFLRSFYKCHMLIYIFHKKLNLNKRNIAEVMIKQSQIFFFFYFSLFFFVSSLSYSDRYESVFKLSCIKNSKTYFLCLFAFLILSFINVVVRITMLPPYYIKQYPDTTLIILMIIFNLLILITNEILKKVEEKIKINRQKYLKVLFGTRLGMWSPK